MRLVELLVNVSVSVVAYVCSLRTSAVDSSCRWATSASSAASVRANFTRSARSAGGASTASYIPRISRRIVRSMSSIGSSMRCSLMMRSNAGR